MVEVKKGKGKEMAQFVSVRKSRRLFATTTKMKMMLGRRHHAGSVRMGRGGEEERRRGGSREGCFMFHAPTTFSRVRHSSATAARRLVWAAL